MSDQVERPALVRLSEGLGPMPPKPATEYLLGIPSRPHEAEWISSMDAWDDSAMDAYGRTCWQAGADAERKMHDQWKRELRQMAEDSADRGDVFAQRVLRALGPNVEVTGRP